VCVRVPGPDGELIAQLAEAIVARSTPLACGGCHISGNKIRTNVSLASTKDSIGRRLSVHALSLSL
jgi:hypothetical protein